MGTSVRVQQFVLAARFWILAGMTIVFLVSDCHEARAAAPGEEWIFGADSPVYLDGINQQEPALGGNIIFWSELDSIYLPGATGPSWRKRILFKDLSKGETEPGRALVEGEFGVGSPAMSQNANRVVWQEGYGTVEHIYYMDVDFSGGFIGCPGTVFDCAAPVSPSSPWQEKPTISPDASKIAWEEGRGHDSRIHLFDFNTGREEEVFGITSGDQMSPSLDDEWLVWTDNRDFNVFSFPVNSAIYAKRIGSPEPASVIVTNNPEFDASGYPFPGGNPLGSVSGAKIGRNQNNEPVVVYVRNESNGYSSSVSVHLFNLTNGIDRELAKREWGLQEPSVDGGKVVWNDCSGGWDRCEVVMQDLASGATQIVSAGPGIASSGAVHPVIANNSSYIAWQDFRAGINIYYNRISDNAQGLADRYRPELRMSKYENFEPMPVEQFLTAPGTVLKRKGATDPPLPNPTGHDLASVAGINDYYLDLSGDSIEAGGGDPSISVNRAYIQDNYVKPYLARRNQFPVTVYARIVSQPAGRTSTAIQYWMNYCANDHPQLFHEGDWELVQVDLDGNLQPYRAEYSRHGGGYGDPGMQLKNRGGSKTSPLHTSAPARMQTIFNLTTMTSKNLFPGIQPGAMAVFCIHR